ncbi:MAG: hypothetical protein H6Q78_499 [Candidatus Krumholzibacteriota bacterium]|nr:hypothetical protein [Candidatus Krumholzibacteriota bacterium]
MRSSRGASAALGAPPEPRDEDPGVRLFSLTIVLSMGKIGTGFAGGVSAAHAAGSRKPNNINEIA